MPIRNQRQRTKPAPALQRCPARSPGGLTPEGRNPRKGTQCGNYAGHGGAHTVLIPSNAPWFRTDKTPSRSPRGSASQAR